MGDRVAVLRFGKLQQFASPNELYDKPANAFVAGFIGSPAMNLVTAPITADGVEIGDSTSGTRARPADQAARRRPRRGHLRHPARASRAIDRRRHRGRRRPGRGPRQRGLRLHPRASRTSSWWRGAIAPPPSWPTPSAAQAARGRGAPVPPGHRRTHRLGVRRVLHRAVVSARSQPWCSSAEPTRVDRRLDARRLFLAQLAARPLAIDHRLRRRKVAIYPDRDREDARSMPSSPSVRPARDFAGSFAVTARSASRTARSAAGRPGSCPVGTSGLAPGASCGEDLVGHLPAVVVHRGLVARAVGHQVLRVGRRVGVPQRLQRRPRAGTPRRIASSLNGTAGNTLRWWINTAG